MSVLKIPTTDINFKQPQAELGRRAAAVYTAMNLNPSFPTPPISMADFVILVNAYNTSLGNLRPAYKNNTEAKELAKKNLITAMKALAGYVNEVVAGLYGTQASHAQILNMRTVILSSGFAISKIARPVGNNTGVKIPLIVKFSSPRATAMYALLRNDARQKRNFKAYAFEIRTAATTSPVAPAGPWIVNHYTNGSVNIEGLTSGIYYEMRVASIGGYNTKLNQQKPLNYTPIRSIVIH